MEPKYSPGEPVFVQKPGGAEDEGVLISLVSPFSEDLAPFIVFLDAQSMAEITRGYLPGKFFDDILSRDPRIGASRSYES